MTNLLENTDLRIGAARQFNNLTAPKEDFFFVNILGNPLFDFEPTGIYKFLFKNEQIREQSPVLAPSATRPTKRPPIFGYTNTIQTRRMGLQFKPSKLWLRDHKFNELLNRSEEMAIAELMEFSWKMHLRTIAYWVSQVMLTGILPGQRSTVDDTDFAYPAYDFSMSSSNIIDLSANYEWDDGSTMRPIYDIKLGVLTIRQNGVGDAPINCVMSPEVNTYFIDYLGRITTPASGSAAYNYRISERTANMAVEQDLVPAGLFGVKNYFVNRETYTTPSTAAIVAGTSTRYLSYEYLILYPEDIRNPETGSLFSVESVCEQQNRETLAFDLVRYWRAYVPDGSTTVVAESEMSAIVGAFAPNRNYVIKAIP